MLCKQALTVPDPPTPQLQPKEFEFEIPPPQKKKLARQKSRCADSANRHIATDRDSGVKTMARTPLFGIQGPQVGPVGERCTLPAGGTSAVFFPCCESLVRML